MKRISKVIENRLILEIWIGYLSVTQQEGLHSFKLYFQLAFIKKANEKERDSCFMSEQNRTVFDQMLLDFDALRISPLLDL